LSAVFFRFKKKLKKSKKVFQTGKKPSGLSFRITPRKAREVKSDMTASERRNAILEDLCARRFERINNLAFQYGVTERTIRNDIMILSLEYPIYTAQGNGGGIYVDKNFRLGRVYLKNEQQELLGRLLPGLDGKDAEVMKAILKTFGLEGAKK
jgi:hypothetical protein